MIDVDIAIIGGGWAGSVFSLEYKSVNPKAKILILEKEKDVGGLLRTEIINGYTFDTCGSHIIFSRNVEILEKILKLVNFDVITHERKAFVRFSDRLIPYPIENNLSYLGKNEITEALISFLEILIDNKDKLNKRPKSLREWIYNFFGKWIAEKYLIPYNSKIWKRDLEDIDVDWVYSPGRLPIPQWRDVVRSAMGDNIVGYIEQSKFYYPRIGGIQTLFNSTLRLVTNMGVNYIYGHSLNKIVKVDNRWLIDDEIEAKRVVVSIPLVEFLQKLEGVEEHILKLSKKLDYNKLVVTGFALNRQAPEQHWIYVPSDEIIFHRYSWISNYSPFNSPKGKSAIITETTIPKEEEIDMEEYNEKVISDVLNLEIVDDENDILFSKSWVTKYAYPVHTKKSNKARDEITKHVSEMNVILIGRWGCWRYWNMDKVYEDVLDKVKKV